MNTAKRTILSSVLGLAAALTTAGWVAAAGTAASGGGGGHAGASGGGTAAAAPSGGGGAEHAAVQAAPEQAAPQHAEAAHTPAPAGPNQTQENPSTADQHPDENRTAWRHRKDNGGHTYGNPNFYGAVPYAGYINADADGYYNNYYGYSDQNADNNGYNNADNGPLVVEPNSNAAPAQQPAPQPTAPANTNPSPVSAVAQQQNSADNNPQVLAADAAVREAQEAYDVERKRVLEALQQQPDYQQALARRGAAQQQVNAVRAGDAVPDPSHMVPAASAKLEAGDEVTRLQQQAIDADPAAKTAQVRLHEATMRRDQLRGAAMNKYQP